MCAWPLRSAYAEHEIAVSRSPVVEHDEIKTVYAYAITVIISFCFFLNSIRNKKGSGCSAKT